MPYRAFRRNLTAGYFAPFVITLSVLAAIVLWRFHEQASITGWVEHSDQVMLRSRDAEVALREMQAAFRGYVLTADKAYLDKFYDARDALRKNITLIAALVADNPEQERRLLEINDLSLKWTKALESPFGRGATSLAARQTAAEADVQAQAVLDSLESFEAAEHRLRAKRAGLQKAGYYAVFLIVPVLSAVVIAFLSFWGWRQIQVATEQFHQALDAAERARKAAEENSARAEKANRVKDKFIGTVSHELRTPLNSIMLWSAALLRDPSLGENPRRGLAAIDRSVKAQAQLIEDLLDVSRIESGRMRLDVQAVDLGEVVRAAVESMRVAAEAKSISLREIIDSRVDSIAGDPGRLQQVVWNLVSNAVKFTPNGGSIQVRVERINSHVEIVVADSGQGLEATALGSVFDRFWQADGSGKQGVGLGLSIVKEIVGLHGGTVVAHGAGLDKGSTFTVRLPLPISTIASLIPRQHPTVGRIANAASAPRLDGLSILVVDDDSNACEALEQLLRTLGANVSTATSAKEALAILDELHPDAVISDIGMPVHDGFFLGRELRKWEQQTGKGARTALVALTAYGRVDDKVQILTSGFDSHAIKPVDPVELSTILGTLVASRKGA